MPASAPIVLRGTLANAFLFGARGSMSMIPYSHFDLSDTRAGGNASWLVRDCFCVRKC